MSILEDLAANRKEHFETCKEMLKAATVRYDSATRALEIAKQRVKTAREAYVNAQIAVDRAGKR